MVFLMVMCMVNSNLFAEADEQGMHNSAHLGVSYAINTFAYGISTRAFHFDRTDALIFSAVITLVGGMAYKVLADADSDPNFGTSLKQSMLWNSLGVGLSAGTILMFNF